jgi:hypothetical protein
VVSPESDSVTQHLYGFATPALIYTFIALLHRVLPARHVTGYARRAGRPLAYRLNGLLVFAVTLGAWVFCCAVLGLPWNWLYLERWASFGGACVIGLFFTFAVVLTAPPTERSFLADLFLGRRDNPQWRGIDAKMLLYLVGAVMLELNLASFAAHHWLVTGELPATVLLHVALFTWFVCDYLVFERVHLYTYDLFAERVGFKLGWGCLAFYPYFYASGLWATAGERPLVSAPLLAASAATFFAGWTLARGANLQKYHFKRDPKRPFLGIVPEVLGEGDHRLLVNGFWGLSRHVNYLGEVLMATGLALSLGHPTSPWPWLYPLYYVLLLVPRERDDHRRCADKYGALWRAYCERVPRRIVPGLY